MARFFSSFVNTSVLTLLLSSTLLFEASAIAIPGNHYSVGKKVAQPGSVRPLKRSSSQLSPQPGLEARQNGGTQDPCAYIYAHQNDDTGTTAHDVYACLVTVPFQRAPAKQLVQYVKDTFAFQSTITYLRDPPSSFQQPAIDVLQALDILNDDIDTDVFSNEYAFESALQRILMRMHDGHVILLGGLIEYVSFGSPATVTEVSTDGTELPRVYITDDLYLGIEDFTPSPISTINDQPAESYLERYGALNSLGNLDPAADYYDLFDSQASNIQGLTSYFDIVASFHTDNYISFTFDNGTSTPVMQFLGNLDLSLCTDGISNGADVYNCLVALPPSASSDDASSTSSAPSDTSTITSATSTAAPSVTETADWTYSGAFIFGDIVTETSSVPSVTTPTQTSTSVMSPSSTPTDWSNGFGLTAYPTDPVVAQPDLGFGGSMTGYIVDVDDATKIAVLSIPSFSMSEAAVATFSNTTARFIAAAKAAGARKVVVDLQQNLGGLSLLAWDTFRQFFPNIDPFGGSRQRSSPEADAIGSALTPFGLTIDPSNTTWFQAYVDDPFAATSFLNAATNLPFSDWPELFGPHPDRGDLFSTVQRDDLNYALFDVVATDDTSDTPDGIIPYGYASRPVTSATPPFAPEDIVLLVDGLCSSACALFTESMHHEAGVPMVVAGGLPQPGPQQGVTGARGARPWTSYALDADMALAEQLNPDLASAFPSRDPGIAVDALLFNLQDQIRKDEYFPLQFAYEAADCRIFFTLANFANYTQLWTDAADALWSIAGGQAHCVPDSTGHTSDATDTQGPSAAQKLAWRAAGRLPVSSAAAGYDSDTEFVLRLSDAIDDLTASLAQGTLGGVKQGLGGVKQSQNKFGHNAKAANPAPSPPKQGVPTKAFAAPARTGRRR